MIKWFLFCDVCKKNNKRMLLSGAADLVLYWTNVHNIFWYMSDNNFFLLYIETVIVIIDKKEQYKFEFGTLVTLRQLYIFHKMHLIINDIS